MGILTLTTAPEPPPDTTMRLANTQNIIMCIVVLITLLSTYVVLVMIY